MNFVVLMGRLTNDPDVRYTPEGKGIARYTLAVDRRSRDQKADFIRCITFDGGAQFAEKYLHKGKMIGVTGGIRTDSYTNKDGQKVYTTEVVVNNHYFCDSKAQEDGLKPSKAEGGKDNRPVQNDGFMTMPEGLEGLPF